MTQLRRRQQQEAHDQQSAETEASPKQIELSPPTSEDTDGASVFNFQNLPPGPSRPTLTRAQKRVLGGGGGGGGVVVLGIEAREVTGLSHRPHGFADREHQAASV